MAETVAEAQRSRGPFIMPDGRPLTVFLEAQQLRPANGGSQRNGRHRRRPGTVQEPKDGWTKALPRAAIAHALSGKGEGTMSEAEQAELYALSRVGQRKQRRWLNDKLLRDMAGTLSASDMASLFKPVPFGEQRTTLWEQAAQPAHAVLWDLFRSLDMDKQSRVLQKWEAHVRELQAGPAAINSPAVDALAAWAGVSWKARQAMKRAPRTCEAIEAQVLAFAQQQEGCEGWEVELVLDDLEDGFHRLIAHGLAEYHSLTSHSRLVDGGGKHVVLRRRQVAAAAAPLPATQEALQGRGPVELRKTDTTAGRYTSAEDRGACQAIACSDIVHVLVDEAEQPLSAAVLQQAYLHVVDSCSEPGDTHHMEHHSLQQAAAPHQHQQQQFGHQQQAVTAP